MFMRIIKIRKEAAAICNGLAASFCFALSNDYINEWL